jgi:hypothetical protein
MRPISQEETGRRRMGKPVEELPGMHPEIDLLRAQASRPQGFLTDKTSVPDTQCWRL